MLTRRRHLTGIGIVAATWLAIAWLASGAGVGAAGLPTKLSDQEFWALTEQLSEPGGSFRSDNFLSNERGYQLVIPALTAKIPAGGVYLGVGPEQNFTYIVSLQSRMAFVIDIRRGNLLEHLLYKAIFEMSADRADFLSLLFSRKRPAGLSTKSSVAELFTAYEPAEPTEMLYRQNFKAVIDWLTKKHAFKLSDDDVHDISNIYHQAFFTGGLRLNYAMGGGGGGGGAPSYWELMLAEDGNGENHSYLATEQNFAFVKNLESRNLIVPVVGDFGGPKAIRAVGTYLKAHGGMVAAFYLSNVEQYLIRDGNWGNFCESVATLPLAKTSTYIYSGAGGPIAARVPGNDGPFDRFRRVTGGLDTSTRPIEADAGRCAVPYLR